MLTYLGRLLGGEYTGESQLPAGDEYTGESRLPGDEYTGESRLPGNEYTEESRLPCSEYTGELITNSNNCSNIRNNSKSCLDVSNGTRRRCLMKKTRVTKSRDTVPLKLEISVVVDAKVRYFVRTGAFRLN